MHVGNFHFLDPAKLSLLVLVLSAVLVDFLLNVWHYHRHLYSLNLTVHLIRLCIIFPFPFLFLVHYVLPSAASIPLTYYYQCLIIHTKVQLNRCISPNVSLPHWFERNGVFERKGFQSSRCLAYLNGRHPPIPPHTHTYTQTPTTTRLPIPETACGLEQEALCLLLF